MGSSERTGDNELNCKKLITSESYNMIPTLDREMVNPLVNPFTNPNMMVYEGESCVNDGIVGNRYYAMNGEILLSYNTSPGWTEFTIGDGVKIIADNANMTPGDTAWITRVTIPSSVQYIGSNAFGWADMLSEVNYDGTKAQWKQIKGSSGVFDFSGSGTVHCSDGDLTY